MSSRKTKSVLGAWLNMALMTTKSNLTAYEDIFGNPTDC